MTGADLIVEARKLLGVPFFHSGRDENGLDCIGTILLPAWRLGLSTFEPRNYSPTGWHSYLLDCLDELGYRLPYLVSPEEGDVLALYVRGHVSHLAYLTAECTIIHAHMRVGKVIEEPLAGGWEKRIASTWRWKGLMG